MKCKFCGREVPEGENKCPACGAFVENDSAEAQGQNQAQQGYGEYGTQGRQDRPQYGITSQGFSSQDQQNQYQYGSAGQNQQNQYQYGSTGQNQQNQYQYGSSGQDFQNQYQSGSTDPNFQNQNGSWDQNQYGSSNQGFQGQYQDGAYGQNQQGQYQYGPDQAGYSYGRTEGGNYGQPVKPISGTPYMIFAIITTLFCCLPLGIAAIVFASKINTLQKAGDYAGAQEEAKKAKLATIIGMVFGAIVSVIYIGIAIAGMKEYTSSDTYPTVENIKEFNSDIKPLEPEEIDDDDDEEELDETEDIEEADEQKPPVQLAEPSSELGATWDTFTVQVNDKILTLPCSMGELEAAGLTLDTEDTPENYVVNAREYVYTYFKDANDNEILIDIVNLTEEPKSLKECIIGGVTVYDYDVENGGLSVIFPGGIQIGTPKADVLAKYGDAGDSYEDDEDYSAYTWYSDNAYYSYCEIDIDAETGLVCNMFMENYGE